MRHRSQRRGVMLTLVVMMMAVVAGVFAVLGANVTHSYRQRQADRVRVVSRAMADSAASYARTQMAAWSKEPPSAAIDLDVKQLLTPKMNGMATVRFATREGRSICQISASAEWGPYRSTQETELTIPASRPAG